MIRFFPWMTALGFLVFCAENASARVQRFDCRDAAMRNLVQFTSEAPLDRVVGVSSLVSGWIEIDLANLAEGVRSELEIDMRGFETGLDSRNDWVRDKAFAAAEHPSAVLAIQRWSHTPRGKLGDGAGVTGKVDGILKMRGMARAFSGNAKFSYFRESDATKRRLSGNLLRMSVTGDADLASFGYTPVDGARTFARVIQLNWDLLCTDSLPVPVPPTQEGPKPKERKN
jgi:polyisoprenoid-binding protein YceI